jgi:hypothetical protein
MSPITRVVAALREHLLDVRVLGVLALIAAAFAAGFSVR